MPNGLLASATGCRHGNLELKEQDYTSGIVVAALANDIITAEELERAEISVAELRDRIHDHGLEETFLRDWEQHYTELRANPPSTKVLELDGYIEGLATVLQYHLASRGYK